jgi:hypothetical protein
LVALGHHGLHDLGPLDQTGIQASSRTMPNLTESAQVSPKPLNELSR